MDVIGVIYLGIYRHIQRFFGIYLQWREQGVIEEIMVVLHGKIREQAKKNQMDNFNHD